MEQKEIKKSSLPVPLRSLIIAFSMFSRVPMPIFEWDEKALGYMIGCFPLVGLLEGVLFYGLWKLLTIIQVPQLSAAVLLTAFPIFYTGAIHMDGFLDTVDALSSNAPREKKLEILKDPHAGSFAILGAGIWLLAYFAGMYQLTDVKKVCVVSAGFVLSRCFSGISLGIFQNARGSGTAFLFADGAKKKNIFFALILQAAAALGFMCFVSLTLGLSAAVILIAAYLFFAFPIRKAFGGVTGDLTGFWVSLFEVLLVFTFSFL